MRSSSNSYTLLTAVVVIIGAPVMIVWALLNMPATLAAATVTGAGALAAILVAKNRERQQIDLQQHRATQLPVYEEFIKFLFEIFKSERLGKAYSEAEMNVFLIDFAGKMVLFGSDRVIKAYAKFRLAFMATPGEGEELDVREGFRAFGDVLLAIREDLGHKNKDLTLQEVFLMFINDPEVILNAPPSELQSAIEAERASKIAGKV